MHLTKTIRPDNPIVFISDSTGGEPPVPVRGAQFLSTSSCASIVCCPEVDGPTELMLGFLRDVDPGRAPTFEAKLDTPKRDVVISTADNSKVLEMKVTSTRTRIRVWTNHPQWPDQVIVGIG